MDYKQKLIDWNNGEKYKNESEFLAMLINPKPVDFILDYGCGTGLLAKKIEDDSHSFVYVTDVNNYLNYVLTRFNERIDKVNKVYFMHSIAHIPDPGAVLKKLKNSLLKGSYIYIVTPNKQYLDNLGPSDHKPDPTVVKHYYPTELDGILKGVGYEIVISGQLGSIRNNSNERLFIVAKYG